VHPNALEVCNAIDDNCTGGIDEGVTSTYYLDDDGDNYGVDAPATNKAGCSPPPGYALAAGDCNDKSAAVHPGATEVCNGVDDNCAGGVDEGVGPVTWYSDTDGDGYGNPAASTQACAKPPGGWSTNGGDCDDADANRFPNNPEVCDGKDNDCNPATPEPGITTYYRDADGDGYGTSAVTQSACQPPAGYVSNAYDCDDANAAIRPDTPEVCNNGIDDNCSGAADEGPVETWPDADQDTFGDAKAASTMRCGPDAAHVTNHLDCNDASASIHPNAVDVPLNGIDENCDGTDTGVGAICGAQNIGVSQLPFNTLGELLASENAAGNPAGANFYWDDYEIKTTAGMTFTTLVNSLNPLALLPRIYTNAGSCGPNGFSEAAGWYSYHPKSNRRSRQIVESAAEGYAYQIVTSRNPQSTGEYELEIVPGKLGSSCGKYNSLGVWPLGWRETGSLAPADIQPPGSVVNPGFRADDFEFYLRAGSPYTLLYGAMFFPPRVYLAKAGACGTSLGVAVDGIANGGARLRYAPAESGVYVAYLSATVLDFGTTPTGYLFNVVQGDVGASCFAGPGSAGGTGDDLTIYPADAYLTEQLEASDRRDSTFLGGKFFDDFETWLEAGEVIRVTMTASGYSPRLLLTSRAQCTSPLAASGQLLGATATLTYAAPAAGVYVIVATSDTAGKTGPYTLESEYLY
jgi:hypothetical protein